MAQAVAAKATIISVDRKATDKTIPTTQSLLPPAPSASVPSNSASLRLPPPAYAAPIGRSQPEFHAQVVPYWNQLSEPERLVAFYMQRAGLAGNRVFATQMHRDSTAILGLCHKILENRYLLAARKTLDPKLKDINVTQFLEELRKYFTLISANHGPYRASSYQQNKISVEGLDYTQLTPKNLQHVLEVLEEPDAKAKVRAIALTMFKGFVEPSSTITNNIAASGSNFYGPGFDEKAYQELPAKLRNDFNNYFYIDDKKQPSAMHYSTHEHCAPEYQAMAFWLNKAHAVAVKHPEHFDAYFISSISTMIDHLEDGLPESFDAHSIEWKKSNSRLDWNFGLIETLDDPKQLRGSFQAEVTIKIVNMSKINAALPLLEAKLPVDRAFLRDGLLDGTAELPNASVNVQIFGAGRLGPERTVAAYCLPNNDAIRNTGSKQIIYARPKEDNKPGALSLARKFANLSGALDWHAKIDPTFSIGNELWDALVLLHETVGHGSGKLATHTFRDGEPLKVGDKKYAIGDTIAVTGDNAKVLLGENVDALEEMRADITALYMITHHAAELAQMGVLDTWNQKLGADPLAERALIWIGELAMSRLSSFSKDCKEVNGAHAIADSTILNFLLSRGGMVLAKEPFEHAGKTYTRVGIRVIDLQKAKAAVQELLVEAQRIKSTADNLGCDALIDKYGKPIDRELQVLLHARRAGAARGKYTPFVYPQLDVLVHPGTGKELVYARWPQDAFAQALRSESLALSPM
jgi:hypothetical protein